MQQHLPRYILGGAVLASLLISWPVSVLARTPNDQLFDDQWYLEQIKAQQAWDTTIGSSQLVIAVLDTGLDLDHPDLKTNLWTNTGEIPDNQKDDDGNGYIDDVHGWDFIDDDAIPEPETASEETASAALHGTLVAGLIGADTHNAVGYAGVMWKVKIMPLRILNEYGSGNEEMITQAINYAVANGARVINMSFAGPDSSTRLRTAVQKAYDAGVVVVAALGNDGRNVDEYPTYPACFQSDDADWVIGVTATDKTDSETGFTNYGKSCADLSAPGIDILGLGYQQLSDDSAYSGPWNGTSTASPLVAGAAGLLLSVYPSLTPADVQTILKLAVDPIGETISGRGTMGVGRINLARALAVAPSFAAEDESLAPEEESTVGEAPEPMKESGDGVFLENAHASFLVFGAPAKVAPQVRVLRADGTDYATFPAYGPNFQGGVHVASADFNADGVPEVVTGAGPTGGPHVRVFKAYGAVLSEFFAYDKASDKGVEVAVGDVDGDGAHDIVTSVGAGVSNDIVVWSQTGEELTRFTATGFTDKAPLKVAVADVDNDWQKEIIVFSTQGESRVAVYNADGSRVLDYVAFPGVSTGVQVAVGDFNDDYRDEMVTVTGVGSEANVRIYNKIGALWKTFTVPQPAGSAALVAVTDIDVDGALDIVLSPEKGGGSLLYLTSSGDVLGSLSAERVQNGGHFSAW